MQLAEGKTQTTLGLITKKQKPKTIHISITVSWEQGAHARVGNNEQMWVTEEWKDTFWSDKSWFLLQQADGSMNPSYSASAVAACGGVMWGIFPCIDASFVWHSVPKYCCWTAVLLFGQSCLFLLFFFSTTCLEEDKVSCFLFFFQGTNNHLMVSGACRFIQVVLRSQLRRARSYYIQEIKYLQALLTLPKHWIHPNPCDISFLLC